MSANTELTTMWSDIADAIRDQDQSKGSIVPVDYPERIRGISTLHDINSYPIYVTAPAGSTVTATHSGGGVYSEVTGGDGSCVIWVDETGEYTVTGTTSGGSNLSSTTTLVGMASISITLLEKVDVDLRLCISRYNPDTTSIGNYAIFAGGGSENCVSYTDSIYAEAFDSTLVRTQLANLDKERGSMGSTTIGNYALFAGGWHYGTQGSSENIEIDAKINYYTNTLTHGISSSTLSLGRAYPLGTTVGTYALFAGGYYTTNGSNYVDVVDAFTSTLTRKTCASLSSARYQGAFNTIGNYALYTGGRGSGWSNYYDTVDVYNSSLTHSLASALQMTKFLHGGTVIGSYLILGEGFGAKCVDTYTSSLTHGTASSFINDRQYTESYGVASTDRYAVFYGGDDGYYRGPQYINTYDKNLVYNWTDNDMEHSLRGCSGARAGKYILFGGGQYYIIEDKYWKKTQDTHIDVFTDSVA